MQIRTRTLTYAAAGAAIVASLVIAFWPAAVVVETAPVVRGALQVTVEEQGETRARDRFVVAAPVGGRLLRVTLRDGDPVQEGQAVATLAPLPVSARERDEINARVAAAAAALRSAEAELGHASDDAALARRESERLERLFARALVPRQQVEEAQNAAVTLEKEVTAARYRVKSAEADLRGARAGLLALDGQVAARGGTLTIRAPASGRVLRVLELSERVVTAGTPIVVLGDVGALEVVMEMLSTEAVAIAAGMPALLEDWGGEQPLEARVRRVEPYAFTKVSALGVEEKRTRVVLDLIDPPGSLGDGYRVTGRVEVWSAPAVLKAPLAALFRCGQQWCVFAAEGGRARRREIRIGHRNAVEAEVLAGLREGERLVRHPSSDLEDGARIRERE